MTCEGTLQREAGRDRQRLEEGYDQREEGHELKCRDGKVRVQCGSTLWREPGANSERGGAEKGSQVRSTRLQARGVWDPREQLGSPSR